MTRYFRRSRDPRHRHARTLSLSPSLSLFSPPLSLDLTHDHGNCAPCKYVATTPTAPMTTTLPAHPRPFARSFARSSETSGAQTPPSTDRETTLNFFSLASPGPPEELDVPCGQTVTTHDGCRSAALGHHAVVADDDTK